MNKYTINDITRASGGFAMLAVDQREAMRMMFAAAGAPAPVADSVLYSAAIFLIPICISFDTAEKRRYATYLILNRRFSFEF